MAEKMLQYAVRILVVFGLFPCPGHRGDGDQMFYIPSEPTLPRAEPLNVQRVLKQKQKQA